MSANSKHILIIGWDGVRVDTRQNAHTPWLDRIVSDGFLQDVRVDDRDPTMSGPVWATTMTGVYADKHKITSNEMFDNGLDTYPDVLTLVRQTDPGLETFSAAQWPPLMTNSWGGPLFVGGGYLPTLAEEHEPVPVPGVAELDDALVGRCAAQLLTSDPNVMYIHLDFADAVSHAEGITDLYQTAVEQCDALTGVLLAAIEARPNRANEDWTVLIVSDHGQHNDGGHGGETDEERNAWIAGMGPRLTKDTVIRNSHVDVAAEVLATLGLPIPDWYEGEPFTTASAEE